MVNRKQTNKNIKYGVVGGIAGACLGAPLLGAGLGIVAANKNKIKTEVRKFDNYTRGKK